MVWDKRRVVIEIKMAISSIYGIRMHTPHKMWTDEQVKLIVQIEHDLVELRNSIKEN